MVLEGYGPRGGRYGPGGIGPEDGMVCPTPGTDI